MNQDIRNIISHDWITFIIIGCSILIAIIKYKHPKKFEDFISTLSSNKFLSGTIHNNSLIHPFNLVLIIVQWITISLFIYIGYCYYNNITIGQEFSTYLYILGGYIIFEQAKLRIERFIGYLIHFSPFIKLYTYRKLVFSNLISLLILFFCTLLVFRNASLQDYYIWFLGLTAFIYLISLAIMVRKSQNEILNYPSYFILYFCTLEIAPYYILYKVFI